MGRSAPLPRRGTSGCSQEAEELEERARRRGIVVDEHTLFDFYDERIPRTVVSGAALRRWWKKERQQRGDLLTFDPAMLVRQEAAEETERAFPRDWHEGPLDLLPRLPLRAGRADDGVSIELPVETLNQVDEEAFSWLVPGLREELVIALIRSLPKRLRVNFVPAPNHAKRLPRRRVAGGGATPRRARAASARQ